MTDPLEQELIAYKAQKIMLKNKMFSLIKRQLEILEYLEYSIDQDDARMNHLIYTKNILEIAVLLDNIVKVLASLDGRIAALESKSD